MDASLPKIRRLRATPVNVPLARPHPTASGVVSSAPLVLMDLETDQGLTGHAYVFVIPRSLLGRSRSSSKRCNR